jgi:hypothetical protein
MSGTEEVFVVVEGKEKSKEEGMRNNEDYAAGLSFLGEL